LGLAGSDATWRKPVERWALLGWNQGPPPCRPGPLPTELSALGIEFIQHLCPFESRRLGSVRSLGEGEIGVCAPFAPIGGHREAPLVGLSPESSPRSLGCYRRAGGC